ncbi:MAG TPA: hypothetical protein VNO26_16315 [Candidatus Limnocylindria bacterium]|nr:hypothetical protein [Candidatus Limnocylindria bacterium]
MRRSSTDAVVYAVGQRVYVNRPPSSRPHVDLTNEEETKVIASLADGVEVMVVAWRPRGATGTRYCVRSTRDGLEGWLAAASLRRTVAVTPPAAAGAGPGATTAPAAIASSPRDPKSRFGRR